MKRLKRNSQGSSNPSSHSSQKLIPLGGKDSRVSLVSSGKSSKKSGRVKQVPSKNLLQIPTGKPLGKVRSNEKLTLYPGLCQWPKSDRQLEDAPEIYLLFKKSHWAGDDKVSCLQKVIRALATICKRGMGDSYGLANFKPITARTNNNIEYIKQLQTNYSKSSSNLKSSPSALAVNKGVKASPSATNTKLKPTPSSTSTKAKKGVKIETPTSNSSALPPKQEVNPAKALLLREFYEACYQTLEHLEAGKNLYKQIILSLTFTKYSEFRLTGSEVKLSRGKSIIGSCIWVVACALKQLQEDPAVMQFEAITHKKKNSFLSDIASEILVLINLSLDTWNETIMAVNSLERVHIKTEQVFARQMTLLEKTAKPDSVEAAAVSVHLKKFRRAQSLTPGLEFQKLKPEALAKLSLKKRIYPRLLFKMDYSKPQSQWKGLDPIGINDKMQYLKELLKFIKTILENVKDAAIKIGKELQGGGNLKSITSYEKGLDKMEEFLNRNMSQIDWSVKETQEFFETDKIFLDEIDLVTLGAGVTRHILHDARHTMHICYETIRLLNFSDFMTLPEYDRVQRIFYQGKDEMVRKANQKIKRASESYDIEEEQLDLRMLGSLFKQNPYIEVVKELPIYCPKVGFTLQDADLVFTPSSEKLLNAMK